MKLNQLSKAITLGLTAGFIATANAQIEEIVVTAQKRAENVQDVPIAISAFDSGALIERAVTNVGGLSNLTPNVTLDGGTPFSGSSQVLAAFVRGIGANDFAFNIDPGVGVYLDGVYLARTIGANQDLMDVERIEILKGPQGTLFGRNTIGGAISIVTQDPGEEFGMKADVTVGSYNLTQFRGTMNLPISENVRSSISFSSKSRDGHLERERFPGISDYNTESLQSFPVAVVANDGDEEGGDESTSTRFKLVWDTSDRSKLTFAADYSDSDTSQMANSMIAVAENVFVATYNCAIQGIGIASCPTGGPPPEGYLPAIASVDGLLELPTIFGVNVDDDPTNDRVPYDSRFLTGDIDKSYANGNNSAKLENWGVALTYDYEINDNMALKSITAYRNIDWIVGMDLDGSPLNFQHTSFTTQQEQFSQEFQLTGTAMDERLNYAVGVYYFMEEGSIHDYVTFAEGLLQVDGNNDLKTENYAVFAQFDYELTDQLTMTLGGRYTSEDKEFEGFQTDNNALNYKISSALGDPTCASLTPISEECRISQGFPNPGQPQRYYVAGTQNESFSDFSPKVGLSYHITDDVMVYTSWSEGYKTGGWTTRLSNPLSYAPSFEEETASSFEVGIKSTMLDNTLQMNAAVFTTDYEGIQLNFQQGVSPVFENAGDAEIKGAELEVMWVPNNSFTLNVSTGYLDAEYTSVDDPAEVAPNIYQAGIFEGAELPKTPEFKFNISPRFEQHLGNGGSIVWLVDYTHTSKMWNDTERTYLLERPSSDVVNFSITYREPEERWHVTLGGTNITDERYPTTGQAQIAGGQFTSTWSRPEEYYLRIGMDI